jgi:hypothetical protein
MPAGGSFAALKNAEKILSAPDEDDDDLDLGLEEGMNW